ncbi:Ig-like domain-containing protein, partial [Candidatus Berkelbacteria bacterium]|nr:Ig-like domain-containing protein [Candidatus Berkelbacteria bacterium]
LYYGENFGTPGVSLPPFVTFQKGLMSAGVYSALGIARVTVPKNTETGATQLIAPSVVVAKADFCTDPKNAGQCSNPLTFTVHDCRTKQNICAAGQLCCPDGSCGKTCLEPPAPQKAAFAWCFSTGEGCAQQKPPTVLEECSAPDISPPIIPSPSPATFWPTTGKALACTNSIITVKFSESVDPKSVTYGNGSDSSFLIEECTGDADSPCAKISADPVVLNDVTVGDDVDGKNHGGIIAMPKLLKPNTTYRVSLSYGIVSANSGLPIQPTVPSKSTCTPLGKTVYCFTFTTMASATPCDIDKISVSPTAYTTDYLGPVYDPLMKDQTMKLWLPIPFPKDHCQVLDPNAYTWHWHPAQDTASTPDLGLGLGEAIQPTSVKTGFNAKQQTPPGGPLTVTATEDVSKKSGIGTLTINPGPPRVYEECTVKGVKSPVPSTRNPGGNNVCVNAVIAVEINQQVTFKTNGYRFFECQGKKQGQECDKTGTDPLAGAVSEVEKDSTHWQYELAPDTLKPDTWYLVEIATSTKGTGQFSLPMPQKQGCRSGVGYCFTFKTRTSGDACAVKSVDVLPGYWLAQQWGIQQAYDPKTQVWVDQEWKAEPVSEDPCVLLKNTYAWSWGIDTDHAGFAAIDPDTPPQNPNDSATQRVAAYKETDTKTGLVKILATAQNVTGSADMQIFFPFPQIDSFEPGSCGQAAVCANSPLYITFTVPMKPDSLKDKVFLYRCTQAPKGDDICPVTDATLSGILAMSLPAQP